MLNRKDYYLAFDNKEDWLEFCIFERESLKTFKQRFLPLERLVYFCSYHLSWSREKIHRRIGISKYNIFKIFNKIRMMK